MNARIELMRTDDCEFIVYYNGEALGRELDNRETRMVLRQITEGTFCPDSHKTFFADVV